MGIKSSVLERILRPFEGDVPPEFARRLLTMGFTEVEKVRYRELSEKVQLGTLSDSERSELDELLTADDVLTILHAKVRKSLAKPPSAA